MPSSGLYWYLHPCAHTHRHLQITKKQILSRPRKIAEKGEKGGEREVRINHKRVGELSPEDSSESHLESLEKFSQ